MLVKNMSETNVWNRPRYTTQLRGDIPANLTGRKGCSFTKDMKDKENPRDHPAGRQVWVSQAGMSTGRSQPGTRGQEDNLGT